MNSQEYHSLQEAYMNVYQELDEAVYGGETKKPEAPKDTRLVVTNADKEGNTLAYQNLKKGDKRYRAADHLVMGEETREFDEGIGSAIKGLKGLFAKKKKPEAQKPESRGDVLRKKYGTETSPKQQILAKTRERAERDEKEYGDSPYSKSVATKSREAHNTRLKAGYSLHRATGGSGGEGGSGEIGSGNKARKRAAALNNSYDLFDYMMEYLISEGYADTNENALVIMVNMSEEWRESVISDHSVPV